MSDSTKLDIPKRRWHQFSLKTLLIVMVLSTAGVGWLGVRSQRARQNRARVATSEKEIKKAVAAIEGLGGTVKTDYENLRPQTWLEQQFDDPGDSDDPVGIKKVTTINLSRSKVTDADLVYLKEMPHLQSLDLSETHVTDAGLANLEGLTALESLDLTYIWLTDAGVKHLRKLTNLKELNLSRSIVSDVGLEHLKEMKNLKRLDLSYTKVTDAGQVHLSHFAKLESLHLYSTGVTGEGEMRLQQALPECEVEAFWPLDGPTLAFDVIYLY